MKKYKIYLENETLHTFNEMKTTELVATITSASPEDQVTFWTNLR